MPQRAAVGELFRTDVGQHERAGTNVPEQTLLQALFTES